MTLKLKYEKYVKAEVSQLGKGIKKDKERRRKSQKRGKSRYKALRWDRLGCWKRQREASVSEGDEERGLSG